MESELLEESHRLEQEARLLIPTEFTRDEIEQLLGLADYQGSVAKDTDGFFVFRKEDDHLSATPIFSPSYADQDDELVVNVHFEKGMTPQTCPNCLSEDTLSSEYYLGDHKFDLARISRETSRLVAIVVNILSELFRDEIRANVGNIYVRFKPLTYEEAVEALGGIRQIDIDHPSAISYPYIRKKRIEHAAHILWEPKYNRCIIDYPLINPKGEQRLKFVTMSLSTTFYLMLQLYNAGYMFFAHADAGEDPREFESLQQVLSNV